MSYGNALIPFSKEFASKNADSFCLKLQNCKIASINTVLSKNEVLATTATMNMRKKIYFVLCGGPEEKIWRCIEG